MFAGTAFHGRTAANPESKTQIDLKKRLERNKKDFAKFTLAKRGWVSSLTIKLKPFTSFFLIHWYSVREILS